MASNQALTQVDTRDVVYTIEHVAALFHVKVDSAREYTYRKDFPAAHQLGARLLWDRDEILSWFRSLPRLTLADRRRGESVVARKGESVMEQVIIGVDPHKLSATIEVVDKQEHLLGSGRFTTDKVGYAAMRSYVKAWPNRVWAVEGAKRRRQTAGPTSGRGRPAGH
jgi:hypothetical protein